jgi:hypothetical protein
MKLTAIAATFLFIIVMTGFTAYGEEPVPKPKTEDGITFISGGVGQGEIEYLRSLEGDYNLRLLFAAEGTGEFLADVRVKIADAKGKTVLDTVSDGPRFLAKIPPGSYRITADRNGTPITRSVKISGKRAASEAFFWKVSNKNKPVE